MKEFKTVVNGVQHQFSAINKSKFSYLLWKLGAKIGHLKLSELTIIEL